MRDPIRQAERLMAIRLRYTINSHLEDCGITTPAAVSAAIGLSVAEAAGLLRRRQWRAGMWPRCRLWPGGLGCRSCRRASASCRERSSKGLTTPSSYCWRPPGRGGAFVLAGFAGAARAFRAAGGFQKASFIHYEKGRIEVTDRPGLESVACECYGIVRRASDRLLGLPAGGNGRLPPLT
jgi:hypothetical protein